MKLKMMTLKAKEMSMDENVILKKQKLMVVVDLVDL